jgi:hypothetical protein
MILSATGSLDSPQSFIACLLSRVDRPGRSQWDGNPRERSRRRQNGSRLVEKTGIIVTNEANAARMAVDSGHKLGLEARQTKPIRRELGHLKAVCRNETNGDMDDNRQSSGFTAPPAVDSATPTNEANVKMNRICRLHGLGVLSDHCGI